MPDRDVSDSAKNAVFFLKLISETTILRRDFLSRGDKADDYLFRIIHVASSMGLSGKSLDESLEILKSYSGDDPQKIKIIQFLIDRASR